MAMRRAVSIVLFTVALVCAGCASDGPADPPDPSRMSPEQLYAIGLDYLQGGQLDLAERQFSHALQLKPDYGDAHAALANTYYYKAKIALAKKDKDNAAQLLNGAVLRFESAIKYKPDSPEPHMGLALVLLESRKYTVQAIDQLNQALAMDPKNQEKNLRCHFYLGCAYGLSDLPGEIEKSAHEYETYLAQFPAAPDFEEVQDILEDNYKRRGLVYHRIEQHPEPPAATQPGNTPPTGQAPPAKEPPAGEPTGKTPSRPRR